MIYNWQFIDFIFHSTVYICMFYSLMSGFVTDFVTGFGEGK